MTDLIYFLTALQIYCKDAHYNFSGIDFKPLHEWADEIAEPIGEYLDEIKENWFLFSGVAVPKGIEINDKAKDFVPTDVSSNEKILSSLLALLSMIHNKINEIDVKEAGISDLLGRLDTHIMKHIALINLALLKKE